MMSRNVALAGGTLLGLITSCICLSAPAGAQAPIWTWTNQYGSVLAVTSYDNNTGAISGTYTNKAANSCDAGSPQAMTGWLLLGASGNAISFSVNFLGCNSTTIWTGQLNGSAGFQSLWLLSLAEPVAWNGIAAGTDAFSFGSGDKAKLMAKLGDAKVAAVGTGTEKLSNTAQPK
jgi:Avidin family